MKNTKALSRLAAAFVPPIAFLAPANAAAEPGDAPGTILQRYVEDYEADPMIVDAHFGVRVGSEWWTVVSTSGSGKAANVTLAAGQPTKPTWFFAIENADYLRAMDRGEVTFGTLAGKARQSDKVPMDADFMPGFAPDGRAPGADFYEAFTKVSFHFWYRGNPEIVPFASQTMRVIHGVDSTALYYEPGLRTIWFSIKKGQHANRNGDGIGPWRKLLIFTGGQGKAKIGSSVVDVKAGERLFVPPRLVNEFWNDGAVPLEGVLIIFGDGA